MKISISKNNIVTRILLVLLTVIFWFGVWEILALIVGKTALLPSPDEVILRLFGLCKEAPFWSAVGNSIFHIMGGLLIGALAGALYAIIAYKSSLLLSFASPIIAIIKTAPVASFIILAWVWIPRGYIPMFVSFLMVMPLMWQNVYTGLKNVDPKLREVCKVFKIKGLSRIRLLYIPSVMPYFSSGFKTALGFAWKAGIAAEVLTTPQKTLGKLLYDSKIYLETVDVFALTAVVIIISFILEKFFVWLIKILENRKGAGRCRT